MLDLKYRRPYWRETRTLMLRFIAPGAVLVLGTLLFWEKISAFSFIGFPLGYFLLMHGFIILGIVVMAWHGVAQGRIDRRHGIHGDE